MSNVTENTTASGAADALRAAMNRAFNLGQIYLQQADSDIYAEQDASRSTYKKYKALLEETCTTLAECAPAPQPAPMPYPTDAQIGAVYEQTMGQHLRSQDAPAVRRFGRAMFLCAWNAAAPKAAPVAPTPQPVPEALRLAEMLTADEWPGSVTLVSYARECVAELRRLHAENERLAAAPKAAPVAPAPQPAAPQGDGVPTWQAAQDPMLECSIQPRPLSHPLTAYHSAMSKGPLHYTWQDKPHRLVYDLIAAVKHYANQAGQAAPAPVAEDADPLQGAANWLVTTHAATSATELGSRLCIGYNRAERLFNAARAQAAQPEGGA